MEEPKLQFHTFQIIRVAFERDPNQISGQFNVDLQEVNQAHKDDRNKFRLVLTISLTPAQSQNFKLMVQAIGDFTMMGEITPTVHHNFTKISAPSIIYPYIRAFVSNLMLQSGMNPVNLPPVNFATLQRKEEPAPPIENPPMG